VHPCSRQTQLICLCTKQFSNKMLRHHTQMHTRTPTHIHTPVQAGNHTHTHACTHTYTHTCAGIQPGKHPPAWLHLHHCPTSNLSTHTHTHTCAGRQPGKHPPACCISVIFLLAISAAAQKANVCMCVYVRVCVRVCVCVRMLSSAAQLSLPARDRSAASCCRCRFCSCV
jgi:hypothetical protein